MCQTGPVTIVNILINRHYMKSHLVGEYGDYVDDMAG